jgi:lipopolysaccharide export system permease protein
MKNRSDAVGAMSILDRYLFREIVKFFLIILIAAAGIYLTLEFFRAIDNFMEAELSLLRLLEYLQLKIPSIVSQILPISVVLAIILTFALMNRNNEILALMSSGASLYSLFRPVLATGLICSAMLFLLSEIVVPITTRQANQIWWTEVKRASAFNPRQRDIWMKGDRSIYHFAYYDSNKHLVSGITLNYFDSKFNLIKRVDARQGVFRADRWVFYDVMIQQLEKGAEEYTVSLHDEWVEPVDFIPQDLKRMAKKSEEMGFEELLAYIRMIESEGYDATAYKVDFFAKFSLPFVCLILALIATGMAVRRKAKENVSISVAYGLIILFFYWVIHSLCLSLGYGGVLPPLLAAWASNFLFICFGLYLLLNVD